MHSILQEKGGGRHKCLVTFVIVIVRKENFVVVIMITTSKMKSIENCAYLFQFTNVNDQKRSISRDRGILLQEFLQCSEMVWFGLAICCATQA